MRILVIDNYDSFTYNIVQYAGEMCDDIIVKRNDEITSYGVGRLKADKILLGPGPGTPSSAGRTMEIIDRLSTRYPMLGICLGHQALAEYFGYRLIPVPSPKHGKQIRVSHDAKGVFSNLPRTILVGLYNSLIVESPGTRSPMYVSARAADGAIMGIRHESLPLEGVQFHPDSILTSHGKTIIHSWIAQ